MPPDSSTSVSGSSPVQSPLSTLPRTAVIGAMSRSLSRISDAPTSPAWMMWSDPRRASTASGRSRPCVSEMTPIRICFLMVIPMSELSSGLALHHAIHLSVGGSVFQVGVSAGGLQLLRNTAEAADSSAEKKKKKKKQNKKNITNNKQKKKKTKQNQKKKQKKQQTTQKHKHQPTPQQHLPPKPLH